MEIEKSGNQTNAREEGRNEVRVRESESGRGVDSTKHKNSSASEERAHHNNILHYRKLYLFAYFLITIF